MAKRIGRPPMQGPKRETIFRFVTTEAEAAKIRKAAKDAGKSLSDYLRSVAIPAKD